MRAIFHRLGAHLPIVFFAALAALTYWLDVSTRPEEPRKEATARHSPDAIVDDFEARRYDREGALLHRLRATAMRHYAQDDRSELDRPELFWQRRPPLRLTAERGSIRGNGEIVELSGQVMLVREAEPSRPATRLTCERLLVWPEEERAESTSPVRIEQGASWIIGSALSANHKTGLYELAGPVRGEFHRRPRHAASVSPTAAIVSSHAEGRPDDARPLARPSKSAKLSRKRSR